MMSDMYLVVVLKVMGVLLFEEVYGSRSPVGLLHLVALSLQVGSG